MKKEKRLKIGDDGVILDGKKLMELLITKYKPTSTRKTEMSSAGLI